MAYDENSNPRHLATVSPEDAEEAEISLEAYEREVERLRKKAGVFEHGGWKDVQNDLIAMWQQGDMAIRSRKTATIEEVEYIRGQLDAFEFLLNLAEQTKKRYGVAKTKLDQRKEQIQTETAI